MVLETLFSEPMEFEGFGKMIIEQERRPIREYRDVWGNDYESLRTNLESHGYAVPDTFVEIVRFHKVPDGC